MGQTMEGPPCPAFLGGCWEPVGVRGKPRRCGWGVTRLQMESLPEASVSPPVKMG